VPGSNVASLLDRNGATATERHELGDGTTVDRHGEPLATLDPAKHLADTVAELTDRHRLTHDQV